MEHYLLLNNQPKGGAWIRMVEYTNFLNTKSIKWTIITSGQEEIEVDEGPNGSLLVIKTGIFGLSITYWWYSLLIALRLNKQFPFSTIVSYKGSSGFGLFLFKKLFTGHFISFFRGAEKPKFFQNNYSVIKRLIFVTFHKPVIRQIVKTSDRMIFQSAKGKETFLADYGFEQTSKDIHVIPNNWNTSRFYENTSHLGQKTLAGTFTILFLGRLKMHIKGVDLLLNALANLGEADFRLKIAGEGEDKSAIEDMVARLKLQEKVTFIGHVKNPYAAINNSHLVVVPSRSEPFPNVVLESASLETPVIASNVDGIPELFADKTFLFDVEQTQALADLLNKLHGDKIFYQNCLSHTKVMKRNFEFDWGKKLHYIMRGKEEELIHE
ncbi:MAG: glycosyltransferase family 4 protein [Cyclobacteriaceae bacterium]